MKNKLWRILDMLYTICAHRKTAQHVLIDTYSSQAFWFCVLCARFAKKLSLPYTAYLHGGDLPKRFKSHPKTSRQLLEDARYIVAPSGYLQEAAEQAFGAEVRVIPNYLDLEHYPFIARTNLQPLRLLWVRSFHKIYQPEWAIDVVDHLRKQNTDVRLTMVGPDKDGSLDKCKQHAENVGVQNAIDFTGKLTKQEWIELSKKHNIFLNTTSADNTPVSVMEAMALGLPVVTTKVGGIPHLFEDGKEGIMVSDANAEKLADVILTLTHKPNLVESISNAARTKAESWDWEIVKAKWLNLLNPENAC